MQFKVMVDSNDRKLKSKSDSKKGILKHEDPQDLVWLFLIYVNNLPPFRNT
jgi:hypothetical protein